LLSSEPREGEKGSDEKKHVYLSVLIFRAIMFHSHTYRCILLLFLFSLPGFSHAQAWVKFLENKGQYPDNVNFAASIPNGRLFVENQSFTYLFYNGQQLHEHHHFNTHDYLDAHVVRVSFLDARLDCIPGKENPYPEIYNYYCGSDRSAWASNVKAYRNIYLYNLYEGIDLEMIGYSQSMEYNFYVASEANPKSIKIHYEGVEDMYLQDGVLHIHTTVNEFYELIPKAFQVFGGQKREVPCSFDLRGDILSFKFPASYNRKAPLIIDPVVIFSTFSGSHADNFGYTATYDDSGYAYSGGTVFNTGFPVSTGAIQIDFKGGHSSTVYGSGDSRDIGILKYTPDGKNLIYATYLGGSGNEDPHSLVVDKDFNLFIFGNTSSMDFPIGDSFYDSSYNGDFDIFIAKLSPDGTELKASTYIGGDDEDGLNGYYTLPLNGSVNRSELAFNYGDSYRGEININKNNEVFVITTTKSTNFPVSTHAFQKNYAGGGQDACVFKMNNDLDDLIASSYIGGSRDDAGYGIAFHDNGDFYVCGGTESFDLPVSPGKLQAYFAGGSADGFIYYIDADFQSVKAATYLGTLEYDQTYFIQTDDQNNVYVTGQTCSNKFPVKNVNYSENGGKLFITKTNSYLDSIIYSGVFGSGSANPDLSPSAFLVDHCERIYFSGWGGQLNQDYSRNTNSDTRGLSITDDAFQKNTDGSDFYIVVFAREMDTILFATYYGGPQSEEHVDGGTSRFDKNGIIYQSVCAGCGGHSDLPTHPPDVHSSSNNSSNCNNAIIKIDLNILDLIADFIADTVCLNEPTRFLNLSKGAKEYAWCFGDGDSSDKRNPLHKYKDTGFYKVTLIAENNFSCKLKDTLSKTIYVYDRNDVDFDFYSEICSADVSFELLGGGARVLWDFGDGYTSSQRHPVHTYTQNGIFTVIAYVDSASVCAKTVSKEVAIFSKVPAVFKSITDPCYPVVTFRNLSDTAYNYYWDFGDGSSSFNKNPVHFYETGGDYLVHLYTNYPSNCPDSAFAKIQIPEEVFEEIIIPNIITPNADNQNDVFHIEGLNFDCEEYKLYIYNRWGQLIFESEGDDLDWDATFEGTLVNNGVYYYVFKSARKTQAGTITVIR
jgi:gliding motility-associated-like protein